MKLGYAILLNNEAHNFIRQVQLELHKELDIGLSRQPPHITIKSPFDCKEVQPHQKYLQSLANQVTPFEIVLNGFDSFGENVLFLNVMPSENLVELHYKILEAVEKEFGITPHEFEGESIRFHVSIAGFQNPTSFQKAKEVLNKYNPYFKFKLQELGLFYYLGEGKGWIVNSRFSC